MSVTRHRSEPPPETIRGAGLRWLLTLLALVFWLYALIGPEGIRVQLTRQSQKEALAAELAKQQQRTRELTQQIESLKADDRAIEAAIRRTLDYQRPGERVLIVPEPAPPRAE
jgi:cell division protein FtsB